MEAMEPVNILALAAYEETNNRLQELSDKLATLEGESTSGLKTSRPCASKPLAKSLTLLISISKISSPNFLTAMDFS
jgi:hypothetical protein